MALHPTLLSALVCPQSREPLRLATSDTLEQLNAAVAAGTLVNRRGQTVELAFEAGLIRADGRVFYPIVDDIPNLLVDDSIALEPRP